MNIENLQWRTLLIEHDQNIYLGMWIFLSVKFASSLLALLAGGWKHYLGNKKILREEKATNWHQLCCKSQEKRLKANLLKNNPSIIQSWPKYQTIPVFIFSKLQAERGSDYFKVLKLWPQINILVNFHRGSMA